MLNRKLSLLYFVLNRFSIQVAATTENCLLTLYPYLAFHRSDQQIILRNCKQFTFYLLKLYYILQYYQYFQRDNRDVQDSIFLINYKGILQLNLKIY